MDEHFRVGPRAEHVALVVEREPLSQLEEVVHLAVVDDLHASVFVPHRLMAGGTEIDHGEPPVAERRAIAAPQTLVVRSTMADRLGHMREQFTIPRRRCAAQSQHASDAAHS
jgi:hypothetical protein